MVHTDTVKHKSMPYVNERERENDELHVMARSESKSESIMAAVISAANSIESLLKQ